MHEGLCVSYRAGSPDRLDGFDRLPQELAVRQQPCPPDPAVRPGLRGVDPATLILLSGANPLTTSTTEAPTRSAPTQVAINDIGSAEDFLAAIDQTIKYFNDGDIVEGTIVKVDRDEVLLDIGYKTEGVIPSRELSIKHDVDPGEVVSVGDEIEALVLQKEDKEGRL